MLGYIQEGFLKNKDNQAWSQPKHKLQLQIEELCHKSNIYSESYHCTNFEEIEKAFISFKDYQFCKNYAEEYFTDMIFKEELRKNKNEFMEN